MTRKYTARNLNIEQAMKRIQNEIYSNDNGSVNIDINICNGSSKTQMNYRLNNNPNQKTGDLEIKTISR